MGIRSHPVPLAEPETAPAPEAPFLRFTALWIQLTGTWCNLSCSHCINASGPRDPWLAPLDAQTVRRSILEAEALGVKEIYFTGGEPFLHREILPLLALALAVAPTTVLTNGTRIDERMARELAGLAEAGPYSLEVRVSLDDVDEEANDRIRGHGAWAGAVGAIRLLDAQGLLPIVTATEVLDGTYDRFREFLLGLGVQKPRVKIMPLLPAGRLEGSRHGRLTAEDLEGFDRSLLQCSETRVVAAGGVYACPILAGLPGARLGEGDLAGSFRAAPLYHPACVTCYETGMSCRNY
jgi:MoaA/NifB/PqqE/SkfB family radical SAM enzyme